MRKQTDFIFRQIEFNRIEEGKSAEDWRRWVKENYLDDGWEVLRTEIARSEGNSVFLGISFVKYEDVETPEGAEVQEDGTIKKKK